MLQRGCADDTTGLHEASPLPYRPIERRKVWCGVRGRVYEYDENRLAIFRETLEKRAEIERTVLGWQVFFYRLFWMALSLMPLASGCSEAWIRRKSSACGRAY
jgi:hypothetical protein